MHDSTESSGTHRLSNDSLQLTKTFRNGAYGARLLVSLQLSFSVRQHTSVTATDMFALRIHDGTNKDPTSTLAPGSVGGLSFDLAEVLASFRSVATALVWTCEDLDCFGGQADALYNVAEAEAPISGVELSALAETLSQVIDGRFVGRDPMTGEMRVDVRAIDSAWWEVRTPDPSIAAAIQARFRAVEPFDERAA